MKGHPKPVGVCRKLVAIGVRHIPKGEVPKGIEKVELYLHAVFFGKAAIGGKIGVVEDASPPHLRQLLQKADIVIHRKAKLFIHRHLTK